MHQRVASINVSGGKEPPDICIMELGGTGKMPPVKQAGDSNTKITVGDIEQGPFIEALRQFQFHVGAGMYCDT